MLWPLKDFEQYSVCFFTLGLSLTYIFRRENMYGVDTFVYVNKRQQMAGRKMCFFIGLNDSGGDKRQWF